MNKLVFSSFLCFLFACSNETSQEKAHGDHEFFPVRSFFNEQVHLVDSFRLPTRKYVTTGNSSDSVVISAEEFRSLARQFLEPDINDPEFKTAYKETSFADQSIPSITFTYTATRPDLELRRMDVLLRPDPVLDDQVKSIYMEKFKEGKDSAVLKKLYWKKDRYFQVITSTQVAGKPDVFTQLKVSWSAD